MMPKIAILGAGPTGLAAAHAAVMAGFQDSDIDVFASGRKSSLFGAQYLHEPIPSMTYAAPVRVAYKLMGTVDQYRRKVYGDRWDGKVSPEDLDEEHDAWDIRSTYDNLWARYANLMTCADLSANDVGTLKSVYALVVSSIPAPVICMTPDEHFFRYTEIWAAGSAPELRREIPYDCPENTVVCNGELSPSYYRISNIFNYKTVEWPGALPLTPLTGVARVMKPTATNCDCWRDGSFLRIGRYGAWDKMSLVHSAFNAAYDFFKGVRG